MRQREGWRGRFGPRAVIRALRRRLSTNSGDLLLRARAFDPEYFLAQLGAGAELARGGDRDLVRSYRERGALEDLAPHPLLEPSFASPSCGPGREPVSARLRRRGMRAPHPLLDLHLWTDVHPAAVDHRYGALGHLLEVLDADTVLPVAARWGMPGLRYGEYRDLMLSAVRPGTDRAPAMRPDAPPLVGAVVEAADDPVGAALHALHLAASADEVVVSTPAERRAARRVLHACVGMQPRVVVASGSDGSPAARSWEGRPALRWAIKTAAPLGARGDIWGDSAFAADLARALRRLGQHVVVDRAGADDRGTSDVDDVVLVLRGLEPLTTPPGPCRVLWVISHPDEVSEGEIASYDLAFAAGPQWCQRMSQRGVQVRPLLQATDPQRFRPGAPVTLRSEVLFVGSARGRSFRPVVRDAIAAQLPVVICGPGWKQFVPADRVATEHLPNGDLPGAYAHAGVVLNDSWPDMAAGGFVPNRVFDAVAAGARVVSDGVVGIEEIFPAMVRTYGTPGELAALVAHRDDAFGEAAERQQTMRVVRQHHSFDARARTLLDAVLSWRAGTRDG